MGEHITCPRCRGQVGIPEQPARPHVTCPHCKMFLLSIDPATGATWQPREPAPGWLRGAGLLACYLLLVLALYLLDEVLFPADHPGADAVRWRASWQVASWAVLGFAFVWNWMPPKR